MTQTFTWDRRRGEADRLSSPSTARNRDPILAVLRDELKEPGVVLEIASGTGEHGVHMARHLPHIVWQPSDPDPSSRRSIEAWRQSSGVETLRPPLDLDTVSPGWAVAARAALGETPRAVVASNMIHIAPWSACEGLIAGAGELLSADGLLYLYGPFSRDGRMVPSNEAFDRHLRGEDSAWGVRALEDVTALAETAGFALDRVVDMPANNLSVCFRQRR